MPCCAPVAPALRQALLDAAPADEAPRDPFGVIAETLSALSMLESEGDVLAALTDPWPFASPLAGIATEVPDGPEPLLDRLAQARVVREGPAR